MARKILCGAMLILVATPCAALAAHGKAGLWNVATTMNMAVTLPPAVLAKMKAAGAKMPDAHTVTSQVCMTQADVDAAIPPTLDNRDMHCATHVTSQSTSAMTADLVCRDGAMAGTGHTQIAYRGAEHFAGSYSFSGKMQGRPVSTSSTFRGDWVGADCGAVKPLARPAH